MITDKLSDFPWHLENNVVGKTSDLTHHFGQENLLDLAGIGLWLFDPCGETTYVNNAIAARLGYSREEMLALPMIALTGQEQLAGTMRLTRGQKQKTPEKHEARFFHRDGSEIWVNISSIPSFDAASTFLGVAWVLIDITESKRLQQEMARENELLNAIVANAEDVIYVKDREGRYLMVNRAGERATGFSPEQVVGSAAVELAVAETALEIQRQDQEVLRTGNALTVEQSLIVEGQPRVFLTSKTPFRAKDGQIAGIVGLTRDITRIKQTEQSLRESEERYQAILENIQDGYFECNLNGKVIFCNDAFCHIHGLSRQTVHTVDFRELVKPETSHRISQALHQIYLSGDPLASFEAEFLNPDGTSRFVDNSISLIRDEYGKAAGFRGIVRDTTERRLAEENRRASVEKFRVMANEAPAMIWLTGPDRLATFLNQRWLEFTGRSLEEELGDGRMKCVHPDDFDHVWTMYNASHNAREPFTVEYRGLRHDGIYRWILDSGTPRFAPEGEFLGYIGSCFDITDRKEAEEALRQSEERYRTILENILDGYYEVDLAGRLTFVNDGLVRMFGLESKEKLLGANILKFADEKHARRLRETASQVHHTGQAVSSFVYELRQGNGTRRNVDISLSPIKNSSGRHTGFRGIIRDVTERKRAEDALLASEERFAKAFSASPEAMCLVTLEEGQFLYVNDAWIQSVGLAREDVIGRTSTELGLQQYPMPRQEFIEWLKREGHIHDLEVRTKQPGGQMKTQLFSYQLIELQGQQVILAVSKDITERKRMEDLLRVSEERYRSLIAVLEEGIVMQDAEKTVLAANESAALIVGLAVDEFVGRRSFEPGWRMFREDGSPFPPETYPTSVALETGTPISSVVMRIIRHDGQERWISINSHPLFHEDEPKPYAVVTSFTDITLRRKAEEALRASEERFAKAFNSSPQPMAILELPSRRYANVNQALVRSSGWAAEEIIGRTASELNVWVNQQDQEKVNNLLANPGNVRNLEVKFRTKEGEVRDFLYSAERIVFNGQPHFLVVANDITERKRAEVALRQSEALLHYVIDSNPDWIFVKDLNHRYRLVNQSYVEALHLRAEDFIGKNDLELGFPEDQVKGDPEKGIRGFWPVDDEVFMTGQTQFVEEDPAEIDGQTHLFNTIKVPLKDPEGQVWGVLGVARDLTEQRRIEANLRASEERFAKAFNASPQPIVIFEASERRIVSLNEAMVRTFGWTADEMVGRTPADLDIWVDLEQQAHVRSLLATQGFVRDLEIKFRVKSGEIREFLYSAETISLENRPHILVVASDITDRLRAERALQESEERYRLLFEHGFAGISRSTLDGRMLECNDALAEIFGCQSREEVLQTYATDFYFDQAEREKLVDDLKRYGRLKNYERLMKRKDGSPVWTLANFSLHKRGPDGPQAEMVWDSIVLDITERKLIEQQLAQSNEQTRAFSARLETIREEERTRIAREIHDNLGQALTGLKLEFSWLDKNLTRATDESLRRKAIPKLKEIAQLLEETIQTVRHIATELRPGVLDTLGLSAAIDWQSREFIRRSGIQGEIQLCHEPPEFPPERATALFRIFQEILTNIARHSRASRFNVRMVQSDGDLILTVRDNGIGINEAQLHDPKSLGLIGMRERVLIFGGSVLVEGQPAGRIKGTIINVKMPLTG